MGLCRGPPTDPGGEPIRVTRKERLQPRCQVLQIHLRGPVPWNGYHLTLRPGEPSCRHACEAMIRVNGAPAEPSQNGTEMDYPGAQRTIKAPARLGGESNRQIQPLLCRSPGNEAPDARPGAGSIEAGSELSQELRFRGQCARFINASLQLDAGYFSQHTQVPSADPVGIGYAVRCEALAQVLGLADVEHFISSVAHEVDSRAVRRLAEKVCSQAVNQGPGIGEEEPLRHEGEGKWDEWEGWEK